MQRKKVIRQGVALLLPKAKVLFGGEADYLMKLKSSDLRRCYEKEKPK